MLSHPRAEMPQHINLDQIVPLPTDLIIPQLAGARVNVPLAVILDAVPAEALSPTRPNPGTATATLPLHEIVAQLPPRFFTARLSQRVVAEIGSDIPTPFQEHKPPSPPQRVEPSVAKAPTPPPPPQPAPPAKPVEAVAPPPPEPVAPPTPPTPVQPPPPAPVPVAAETPAPPPPAPEPLVEPQPVAPPAPILPEPTPVEAAAPVVPSPASKPVEPAAPVPVPVAAEVPAPAPQPTPDEKKFLINLNRCSVEDLLSIKGVGPSLAQRIIAWRTEHGSFNSLDDLRNVPGIGRKTFRALAGAKPVALNRLLGVAEDRELTLQEIVRLASKLPGLQGCMLATADGLLLTGELPPQFDKEAISVFAPQLFRRVARYTKELKVGQVQRFTVFTDQQPISIFGAEEVFFIVFHDSKHFSKRLLRLCERISVEIARLCRQRTTV